MGPPLHFSMRYNVAVNYLYSFLNFERLPFEYKRQFNLARMARLLEWFDHPEYSFSSIHVAGTKGKGSTANFIASILVENGYRTGLYTSPHLSDCRERIRMNGRAISKSDFAQLLSKIKPVLERYGKQAVPGTAGTGLQNLSRNVPGTVRVSLGPITFFEVFTLATILYFAERKVDFGIFEVGMGGRLDATNVLKPLVSVMTPISFDHEEHLGHTLASIAREKAAIIKPSAIVVSGEQRPEARRVIQNQIQKQKANGYFFGSSFRTQREVTSLKGGRFDFQIGPRHWKNFKISLLGCFQIKNAAAALATASLLENQFGFSLKESRVRKGLKIASWPGRFEMVKRGHKTFILDGAHNGASMKEVVCALRAFFPKRKKIAILGVFREKNLPAILKELISDVSSFIVTRSDTPRAQEPRVILETLSKIGYKKPTFWSPNLKEALKLADELNPKDAILVITGSLFLVGEAREALRCPKFI